MKNKSINVLSGMAVVSAIAAVALGFSSGCKSSAAKENPNVPQPVIQPAAAQPVSSQPATAQSAISTPAVQTAANVAPVTTPAIPDAKADTSTYTVQKGDTFSKISRKYGVDMQKLADYNNMSLQKPLKIGVTLKIPQK
ncbi:MAG: LysM peptidoglycan-binding domain-containing protein [Lentisphaerae bacterium]|nr:LysM peptidoglycan-binding domain-containing protein [Lentisphaerota bacterium]